MRWLSFPDWPKTEDRRIFQTDWAWDTTRLVRSKRFFAVYEDRGRYRTLSVLTHQSIASDELPTEASTTIQETDYEPRMESPDKSFVRLVKWCDFLQKGAI